MYSNTAGKIETAVTQKKRQRAYDGCVAHINAEIDKQQRAADSAISSSYASYKQEKSAIVSLQLSGAELLGNNIQLLLVKAVLWLIPTYIGCGFWNIVSGEGSFIKSFGTVYGIIMAIVLLAHLGKFNNNYKQLTYLRKNCVQVTEKLNGEKRAILDATSRKALAEKLLRDFEAHPDLTEQQIDERRSEIDRILNIQN